MAQRVKYTWRGQTYTRKSLRPGKRTVKVRGYCRRQGQLVPHWDRAYQKAKEWGF